VPVVAILFLQRVKVLVGTLAAMSCILMLMEDINHLIHEF